MAPGPDRPSSLITLIFVQSHRVSGFILPRWTVSKTEHSSVATLSGVLTRLEGKDSTVYDGLATEGPWTITVVKAARKLSWRDDDVGTVLVEFPDYFSGFTIPVCWVRLFSRPPSLRPPSPLSLHSLYLRSFGHRRPHGLEQNYRKTGVFLFTVTFRTIVVVLCLGWERKEMKGPPGPLC